MSTQPDGRAQRVLELFPYLCVHDAEAAIAFYTRVLGARETFRLAEPGGRIAHAELALGPATLMLAGEHPDLGIRGPLAYGGTGTTLHLHVADVDAMTRLAEQAGAAILRPPRDEPHGERQSRFRDPFGHEWLLGQQVEALSPEEIQRRFNAGAPAERMMDEPAVRPLPPGAWPGFGALLEASEAEGFRFLGRLREEHESGANRFDGEGEVLLGVFHGGDLVAVGGLNRDPYGGDPRTGRIRHVYVLPEHRRRGTGRALVEALLAHARPWFRDVVLRTDTAAAARFYEALGFAPESRIPGATHSLALTRDG